MMQPLRSTSRPPGVSELKVKSMYRYLEDPSGRGGAASSMEASERAKQGTMWHDRQHVRICACESRPSSISQAAKADGQSSAH